MDGCIQRDRHGSNTVWVHLKGALRTLCALSGRVNDPVERFLKSIFGRIIFCLCVTGFVCLSLS